ncbi:serine hydrolase domain-containing protein [Maribellus maritimus]|uniref:serine hydrolase domain-containing protein n=1 Tax=Maribellus maritimus TaxID=2870838 RepID=UPI001EEA03D6|nr:serine hydrolase [Maribellus maritimus]MCG6189683.1 beta-lactamase family protein [Maribellus maritimus]
MKNFTLFFYLFLFVVFSVGAQNVYFPERGTNWKTRQPSEFNIDGTKLGEAVQFAEGNEYSGSRDLRIAILDGFKKEPFHSIAGPTKKRGGPAGLILKNGYIVAQWGDIERVDMTFSVTKSYLSTVFGVALDESWVESINDKVGNYIWDSTFEGEHNSKITWEHLLNQSSDWSGELFGMHDWADRPPAEGGIDDWKNRDMHEPGTFFKYNDVRVNVLAYSLLQLWRKPLPQVLKEKIMDPIGASAAWRWFGYENSWVTLDGIKIQSVSGGGHSGGGLFINTLDHARFGLLFMNNGNWNGKQLVSANWIKTVAEPSPANESYGLMWWLNKGDRKMEGVPENIFYAAGFGGNYIVVDQKNQMVIVTRWLEPSQLGNFLQLVYDSLK